MDDAETLRRLLDVLAEISRELKLIFPRHPPPKQLITDLPLDRIFDSHDVIAVTEPLGYLDFLPLTSQSRVIVTDSGRP